MPKEGEGGSEPPHILEDQLTLFQPREADPAHPLLPAPSIFSPFGITTVSIRIEDRGWVCIQAYHVICLSQP